MRGRHNDSCRDDKLLACFTSLAMSGSHQNLTLLCEMAWLVPKSSTMTIYKRLRWRVTAAYLTACQRSVKTQIHYFEHCSASNWVLSSNTYKMQQTCASRENLYDQFVFVHAVPWMADSIITIVTENCKSCGTQTFLQSCSITAGCFPKVQALLLQNLGSTFESHHYTKWCCCDFCTLFPHHMAMSITTFIVLSRGWYATVTAFNKDY